MTSDILKPKCESLIQEINAAFSDCIKPLGNEIIRDVDERNLSSANKIRDKLNGKVWKELKFDFLENNWSSFCYLTPKAYLYYVPSLLVHSLNDFSGKNDLLFSVVFQFVPSFWSIYFEKEDKEFNYQISLFNERQYKAVCSFLELVFDNIESNKYPAAQALKWGWNKCDTEANRKSNSYYYSLHHFTYPESKDEKVNDIIKEIYSAFEKTPYPGDDYLCGSDQGDEPAEYALEFKGLDWRTIHPFFLSRNSAALSFLTLEGFRYFLPVYLISDLLKYESNADPVFHLTRIEDDYNKKRLSVFNLSEKKAIINYLQYMKSKDSFSYSDIDNALNNFWNQ